MAMPQRRHLLALGAAALAGVPLQGRTAAAAAAASAAGAGMPAPPPELATELPGLRLQGLGRLRFMGLQVYEAHLWVGAAALAGDAADWSGKPFALEVVYRRSLKGSAIAERSLKEMRRQDAQDAAVAERWLGAMRQLFPDVKAGDRLTGLNVPGMGARFFFNGRLLGDVREPAFARAFFGIWLSDKTSEPELRRALLGSR